MSDLVHGGKLNTWCGGDLKHTTLRYDHPTSWNLNGGAWIL